MSLRARSAGRSTQHREPLQPERPTQTAARAESKDSETHTEGEEEAEEAKKSLTPAEPKVAVSSGFVWISVDVEVLHRETSAERSIRHDSEVGSKQAQTRRVLGLRPSANPRTKPGLRIVCWFWTYSKV